MKKNKREFGKALENQPEADAKIPIEAWFMLKVAENGSLKRWQLQQVQAFMKHQGLSENEEKETYDKAYQRF